MLLDAVEWVGHSGFRIAIGAATVYIDPYRVSAEAAPADLILVTHGHYDHFSPRDVDLLAGPRTLLVGPAHVVELARGNVASLAPGETIEPEITPGLAVTGVAAYNTSKLRPGGEPFHTREAGGLGYDLHFEGRRVYHAGDTDVIPEMDAVAGADLALLPVSGTYVMTAAEAAEAARRIAPALAVPMHWGEHIGTRADAEKFASLAPCPVEILECA